MIRVSGIKLILDNMRFFCCQVYIVHVYLFPDKWQVVIGGRKFGEKKTVTCDLIHYSLVGNPLKKQVNPMGKDRSPESQHNIFYNAQRQVTLNLKQRSGLNSNTKYYASPAYLHVLKRSELKWPNKPGETIYFNTSP